MLENIVVRHKIMSLSGPAKSNLFDALIKILKRRDIPYTVRANVIFFDDHNSHMYTVSERVGQSPRFSEHIKLNIWDNAVPWWCMYISTDPEAVIDKYLASLL